MLTFEQIKELIELVDERHLQALEVERSGFRLRIDGQTTAASAPAPAQPLPASSTAQSATPQPAAPPTPAPAAAPASAAAEEEADGVPHGAHVVESPIVGTFYRRPAPDQPTFVEEGDRVRKGQVLCIVEAMKLMNEIESDADGVVVKIFPQNAQPVEFGEPLFAVKTD